MHAHSRATTRVDRIEKNTHTALKLSMYRCHTALPSLHTHLPTTPTTRSFPNSQRGKSSDRHRPCPWLPIYSHHPRAVSYPKFSAPDNVTKNVAFFSQLLGSFMVTHDRKIVYRCGDGCADCITEGDLGKQNPTGSIHGWFQFMCDNIGATSVVM